MKHQAVMDYLANTLRRMRLQLLLVNREESLEKVDLGLRTMLGLDAEYETLSNVFFRLMQEKTIYHLMEPLGCNYLFFALPEEDCTVVVGPYLTRDLTNEAVLEMAEQLGLPLQMARQFSDFFAGR